MILVFGTPRSGTTAISNYLEGYNEPFNKWMLDFDDTPFRRRILNLPLDQALERLKGKYRVIKEVSVIFDHTSPLPLIHHPLIDKHLFCVRANIFNQALSLCISIKLKKWHGDKDFVRNSSIGEIDEDLFRYQLDYLKKTNNRIKEICKQVKGKLCVFEDLFESQDSRKYWHSLSLYTKILFSEEKFAQVNSVRYNDDRTRSSIDNFERLKKIYESFNNR